ncbi:MAG: hypothetical protein JWN10_2083 [Solirubrobacterales bacterium]|nr:hypothetical protein [Solirubrobacterales bacterium]
MTDSGQSVTSGPSARRTPRWRRELRLLRRDGPRLWFYGLCRVTKFNWMRRFARWQMHRWHVRGLCWFCGSPDHYSEGCGHQRSRR